jgi:hypothetical protein
MPAWDNRARRRQRRGRVRRCRATPRVVQRPCRGGRYFIYRPPRRYFICRPGSRSLDHWICRLRAGFDDFKAERLMGRVEAQTPDPAVLAYEPTLRCTGLVCCGAAGSSTGLPPALVAGGMTGERLSMHVRLTRVETDSDHAKHACTSHLSLDLQTAVNSVHFIVHTLIPLYQWCLSRSWHFLNLDKLVDSDRPDTDRMPERLNPEETKFPPYKR